MKDPIVEEVRAVRRQIEKDFGDDPQRYFDHIYKAQEQHPERQTIRKPLKSSADVA